MTRLAPLITDFLREHMPRERGYSPFSCETYAHSFKLLFAFAARRIGIKPSELHIEQLDAALILDFLAYIEKERGNGAVTRNLRLSAIKAFMRYVEYQVPSALEQIAQIRAIPTKRHDQALIRHLTMEEVRAILNAPTQDAPGIAGPGDDASVLRSRVARLGTGRCHADEFKSSASAEPARPGERAQGAKLAAVEGNGR